MNCEHARQLFDAYLDGELSPSLETELGAHRLKCADCRQALALLEVSEHLIGTDSEAVSLHRGFTDRLLACMDLPDESWRERSLGREPSHSGFRAMERHRGRWRRAALWSGMSAAAALVVLAFLGAFDRGGESKVAGVKIVDTATAQTDSGTREAGARSEPGPGGRSEFGASVLLVAPVSGSQADDGDRAFSAWLHRMRSDLKTKQRSVASIREAFGRLDEEWSAPPGSSDSTTAPSEDRILDQPDPEMGDSLPETAEESALEEDGSELDLYEEDPAIDDQGDSALDDEDLDDEQFEESDPSSSEP